MLCNDKITHYVDKTLLNFVEIYLSHSVTLYLFFHYTFMIRSNSLYAKIYQLRDYIMLIIVQLTKQWPTTASMLCTKLDGLPLFRCFDKFSLHCSIFI